MDLRAFYAGLVGDWSGRYSLWLDPAAPPEVCDTTASARPLAAGAYHLLTYTWSREETEEGAFFLGGAGDAATATWGDSFHMEPDPMCCRGRLRGNRLVLEGTYGGGDETWGWRTELEVEGDRLTMRATNISPDGAESPAVSAEMVRA